MSQKRIGVDYPLEVRKKEVLSEDAALECKEDEPGTFTGYASVFGKRDLQDEIVDPGAFKRTIDRKGNTFPLLWQHNRDLLIGQVMAEEDTRGLKVKGELVLDINSGSDAYTLLKKKMLRGMSIGFRTVKDEWDEKDKVRHIKEAELWEVSLVTFPANPYATVRAVKSIDALSPEARVLLDGADTDPQKMVVAAAVLCGAAPSPILSEEDAEFSREFLTKCYERLGRLAPWCAGNSFENLVRHVVELYQHTKEEKRTGLLRQLTLPPPEKGHEPSRVFFDWLDEVAVEPESEPDFTFLDQLVGKQ